MKKGKRRGCTPPRCLETKEATTARVLPHRCVKMKKKCDEEVKTLPRRVGNKRKSNGEGVEPLPLLGNERKANGKGVEPSSLLGNERNTNGKGVEPFPFSSHRRTRNHTPIGVVSCSASGRVEDAEHEKTPTRVSFRVRHLWAFVEKVDEEETLLVTVTVNGVN